MVKINYIFFNIKYNCLYLIYLFLNIFLNYYKLKIANYDYIKKNNDHQKNYY